MHFNDVAELEKYKEDKYGELADKIMKGFNNLLFSLRGTSIIQSNHTYRNVLERLFTDVKCALDEYLMLSYLKQKHTEKPKRFFDDGLAATVMDRRWNQPVENEHISNRMLSDVVLVAIVAGY